MQAPRNTALDAARGLSVFAMIAVHLLPFEVRDDAGAAAIAVARVSEFLFDKPAPVFCLVAGMAIVLSDGSPKQMVARTTALFVFGVLFRAFVFPTEILSPLALMMLLGYAVWRSGAAAQWLAVAALAAGVPILRSVFGTLAESDWTAAGDHVADGEFGWVTLRYYTIDGNYALVPWLLFVLVGVLWARHGLANRRRAGLVAAAAIPALIAGEVYRSWSDAAWEHDEIAGAYAVFWEPMATLPFVWIGLSTALAVVAVCLWSGTALFARLGRASLTHYVLHILVVFVPLRSVYPAEDWSAGVGVVAFAAYFAVAVPATLLWFRRFDRGPLEGLWAGGRWRRAVRRGEASVPRLHSGDSDTTPPR